MIEGRRRKLSLDELQERARTRVQQAWQEQMPDYEMPADVRDSMVLGTSF